MARRTGKRISRQDFIRYARSKAPIQMQPVESPRIFASEAGQQFQLLPRRLSFRPSQEQPTTQIQPAGQPRIIGNTPEVGTPEGTPVDRVIQARTKRKLGNYGKLGGY